MQLLVPFLLFSFPLAATEASEVRDIATAEKAVRQPPPPADFRMGPGDTIDIKVWRHPDLDMEVTIAPDGTITYPLVGRILISGKNFMEVVAVLTEAISEYYEDPQVTVNILEMTNQKVFVLGEVTTPSVMQLTNDLSILEAVTLAGGINPSARTNNVLLIRGGVNEPDLYTVNLEAIYTAGHMEQMVYLQTGDIVVVPTKTITNMSRYFREIQSVLSPFVAGSAIYRNVISGEAQGVSSALD